MIRLLIATLVFAFVPAVAIAQSTPQPSPSPSALYPSLGNNDPCTSLSAIVTRPSVSNSVCTVRPNHVLVETGYTNTSADGGGNSVAYPQTLIRVGTRVPALELDVAPPSYARASAGGGVSSGTTDVGAGLKYVLGYTPKLSYGAQVFFTAPTGTNGFSAGGTNANYALQGAYTLSSVFSLSGAAQIFSFANNGARYSSFVPSLVLGASLPNSNGVFAEIAQFTHATGTGTPTRTQYLVGATHDVGQRLQLDVEGGFSPSVATGKYRFVGFGASYYF
ncbi:MAG TPA: hypothetical protein VGN14_18100 [Candidatus Elarobacter sp.]